MVGELWYFFILRSLKFLGTPPDRQVHSSWQCVRSHSAIFAHMIKGNVHRAWDSSPRPAAHDKAATWHQEGGEGRADQVELQVAGIFSNWLHCSLRLCSGLHSPKFLWFLCPTRYTSHVGMNRQSNFESYLSWLRFGRTQPLRTLISDQNGTRLTGRYV